MNVLKTVTALLGIFFLAHQSTLWAASTKAEVMELKEEVAELKAGQDAMQSDLAEIKKLLEEGARGAPKPPEPKPFEPKDISIAGAPVMGDPTAAITLIGYSDYLCPFCARHAKQTVPELVKNYIDEGKLKLVMREFPIANLHPRAAAASEAALCAGAQNAYWGMHDLIFNNQRNFSDEDFLGYASTLGLNVPEFTSCVEQGTYSDQIKKDLEEGQELGVRGTPSFVLGYTDPKNPDMVKVTKFVRGAVSYDSFSKVIDELVNQETDQDSGP